MVFTQILWLDESVFVLKLVFG